MPDVSSMVSAMRQAAIEATAAGKPVEFTYGAVTKVSPLTVRVDQKLELGPAQLILTNAVRDYTVNMSVSHQTDAEAAHTHGIQDTYTGGGSSSPTSHFHTYTGTKSFTVHMGLKVGENVLLIRMQGGQKYIILDRVEAPG